MAEAGVRSYDGEVAGGARYLLKVPAEWNGIMFLHCPGFAPEPGSPPRLGSHPAMVSWLLDHGYALASVAYSSRAFWVLEQAFPELTAVTDVFAERVERPAHTIAFGNSIGGTISAGMIQLTDDRLSGAVPMCGSVAGGVATRNQNLDCAFVFKTLIAPDAPLEVVRIADWEANARLAHAFLEEAQATPEGRARIALAAAVGGIPGWYGEGSPEPSPEDFTAREQAQYEWLREVDIDIFFGQRAVLERRAGGNPSWNTDVDYRVQLARSAHAGTVDALYRTAGLALEADLSALAEASRVHADPDAVGYLERYIAFDGQLRGLPVLTMHTSGDGVVVVESEQAYADVVASAQQSGLLRQLYVHRAGHCAFALAETLTGLTSLVERIKSGHWPELDPDTLNALAAELGSDYARLGSGEGAAPAFFNYQPAEFLRPYDARHLVASRA